MYYLALLEIINQQKKPIDGQSLMNKFLKKYGSGNKLNMNKALRKLRENNMVKYEKVGRRIYYRKRNSQKK